MESQADSAAAPAPTRLIVVRHGETDWNVARRLQGHEDVPLNAAGRAQAAAVAARLVKGELAGLVARGEPPLVLSSDLSRARDTAQAIAVALGGLAVEAMPALREQCLGELQGTLKADAPARFPASWSALREGGAPAGGESDTQVFDRVVNCLAAACTRRPGGTVVAVSHGGALQQVHVRCKGMRSAAGVRNVAVGAVDVPHTAAGGDARAPWRVVAWNCDRHVQGGAASFNEGR